MVGICSNADNYKPTIYPTDDNWDDDCFVYPNAAIEIVRTAQLIAADDGDRNKIGALRLIGDSVGLLVSTLARPPQRLWFDLEEGARMGNQPDGTEFFATHWRLWADAEHRDMNGKQPLAEVKSV